MRFAVAADSAALSYRLDRAKLRQARRREGRYLVCLPQCCDFMR
jgi:hypothetical protein